MADATTNVCITCGREMRPHCPFCGSYRCNALVSKHTSVIKPDGSITVLRAFRCTRCGAAFDDNQWMSQCGAPPEKLGRKAKANDRLKFDSLAEAPPGLVDLLENDPRFKRYK